MQDASDVMQLLLKTQTDFSDMEDDDPQVKQLAHVRLCPCRSCGSCGVLYSGKELSQRLLEITPGFRDILHWFSFTSPATFFSACCSCLLSSDAQFLVLLSFCPRPSYLLSSVLCTVASVFLCML